MAHLRVRLRGKIVYDIALSEDRSYVVGRKEDCDIVLQAEKGISREHFRMSYANGTWNVEVVSRYGEVIFNGEKVEQFTLEQGSQFFVPPYEFDFLNIAEEIPRMEPVPSSSNIPAVTGVVASGAFEGSEEKTVIGGAVMAAYIKVLDAQNEPQEVIRLDAGDSWVAGRDPSCQIQIRDQRVSRRQFEIRRAGSQYVIIDLGSVNGTLLNGTPLSSEEPTPIKSGDAISVLTNYLYFELHDAGFQSRLEMVKVEPPNSMVPFSQQAPHEMMAYQGANVPYQHPAPIPGVFSEPVVASGRFDFQKNRPKVIAAAVLLLALAYLFSGDNGEAPSGASSGGVFAPGSPQEAFSKLSPEQQALVRQRYKDAKNLYMQGKYQLAQDEIVKIQSVVPDYEDIKEIERLSKEAIFIQEQQRRQEQLEQAKLETEEKIQQQTEICQGKINSSTTMEQLDECLSPILQFNPEHPRILSLKSQVDAIITERDAKASERAAYQSQVKKLQGIFENAKKVHKVGKPLDAIAAYEKVLEARLPDPNGYKTQSQRNIASLRQMMNSKTATFLEEAEKYYQAQNIKQAILSLRKARVLDPSNKDIPEKIDHYTVELRKHMMTLYQEGILEESFGNVEGGDSKAGAKEKWRKILDMDIPDGEYYKKAYIKLKKYGAL